MSRFIAYALLVGLVASPSFAQDAAAPPADAAPGAAPAAAADQAPAPAAAPAVTPEAAAAKQAFDAELAKWQDTGKQIEAAQKERSAATGDARDAADQKIAGLRREAHEILKRLMDAGVTVYKASPTAYPEINSTLLAVAQYYLSGDARGDGGDQYEQALALIKPLVDAGATAKWPELWVWGGVSAYCTNDVATAADYFAKAREAGALTEAPPAANPSDPRVRIHELALQFEQNLPALKKTWETEAPIRDAEARADDLPRVKLTTTKGDVVIELFENEAPQAVANFITLVKSGFYNGVVFHRVIPGFMAQGGDPTGTGSGGPGYSIKCECYQPNFRHHFRGSLSMAHAGKDTGGSQFFLTFVPTSFLDGRHTVFGRVIEGMDVAASIKHGEPVTNPDKIVKAEVLRAREHEYTFEKLPGR